MPGPFYQKNDVGAINKLVDKRSPRTECEGVVTMVEKTGFVWAQIRGASNSIVVDTSNGITVKQGDKVALRRMPGTSRWTIYGVQNVAGQVGSASSTSTDGGDTYVAAPSNLAVAATFGGVFVKWEPPNDTGDLLFEVEMSSDNLGTGAIVYKVAGSTYFFPCSTVQYARVRSLGKGWSRSGYTGRLSATPLNSTETIQDIVGAMIVEGANIDAVYDDAAGTVTISATQPSITIEEDDLSPSINPINKIIFPAGSVTDDGGGVARVSFSAGPDLATVKKTIQTETVISQTTLVAPAAYINLSIPAGYAHVKIRARLKTDHTINRYTQVNGYLSGDLTNTHYYYTQLQSQGSTAPSSGIGNFPFVGYAVSSQVQQDVNNYGELEINIPFTNGTTGHWQNYTAFNLFHAQGENIYQEYIHVQWLDTSAVSAFRFVPTSDGSNFLAGCYIEVVGYKPEQVVVSVNGDITEVVKAHETPFAYNTTSPLVLRNVDAGGQVERIRLIITTAFNGAPSLTVGDSGNNSRFMSATDSRPSFIASYEITPDYIYSASGTINLYITVGGATLGAGVVVVESS